MEERLDELLLLANQLKATDIHFFIHNEEIKIEFRLNGEIYPIQSNGTDIAFFRYLQYRANLDLANRLIPQTGSFEYFFQENRLSLRFALIYSPYCTNGVLRILNNHAFFSVDELSQDSKQNRMFKELIYHRNGLILFSGPTGSGKTTTLYTLLNAIKKRKIFTLEDPIEIYSNQYVQLQINEKMGLTYAEGIKQIMRHDPDVIMVGEIRDSDAAKMAIRSAMTGHLVLSSIHAQTSLMAIERLSELGVDKHLLNQTLLAVCNQRLCPKKRQKGKIVLYEIMHNNTIQAFLSNNQMPKDYQDIHRQLEIAYQKGWISQKIWQQEQF